jgi:UDP-glucose 4-epimerase
MKILVVGGAGYIGSVCAELLLDEGHDVVILDNLSEGHRRAVDSRARFVEGDLQDRHRRETATTGRSAAINCRIRKNQKRAGLETAI